MGKGEGVDRVLARLISFAHPCQFSSAHASTV